MPRDRPSMGPRRHPLTSPVWYVLLHTFVFIQTSNFGAAAFSPQSAGFTSIHPSSSTWKPKRAILLRSSGSISEYEYAPPNDGGGLRTTLPSAYPKGTPAGLRGEAVRTALRSTQCLAWKLASTSQEATVAPNLASGVLQLEGNGVLDFLNNKLSNSFPLVIGSEMNDDNIVKRHNFRRACLLNAKGRLVDTLAVGYSDTEAFVMPSPGHAGSSLFQRFDPFIFPMDQVKLLDASESSCLFALASTKLKHVETAFQNHFLPKLNELLPNLNDITTLSLPQLKESIVVNLGTPNDEASSCRLLILPQSGMPDCAMVGYTFIFMNDKQNIGDQVWQHLIGDDNPTGPVEVKALEYETLRIEAGQPAFGFEATGAWKDPEITSPTPLELHQKDGVIDVEKGCYLGQEGIASVLKNPRGAPRTLYTVVFQDDDNSYQHQSGEDEFGSEVEVENLTKMPRPGDKLFVLGSNEEIQVGTLTSIAEPYSTGDPTILGLALIRRPDSVLKQMKSKNLQIPRSMASKLVVDSATGDSPSGIIQPPPMDSLDGLEVIIGGTFTIGMLRGIPSRRLPKGTNMFDDQGQVFLTKEEILDQGYVDIEFSDTSATEFLEEKASEISTDPVSITKEEVVSTDDDADEAARKAAKMEMLKQRAEEAMERRRKKKEEAKADVVEESADAVAEEAKRKAEKMKLLQKQAEEAIARRRKKKKEAQ